jgi:hypothetical protein
MCWAAPAPHLIMKFEANSGQQSAAVHENAFSLSNHMNFWRRILFAFAQRQPSENNSIVLGIVLTAKTKHTNTHAEVSIVLRFEMVDGAEQPEVTKRADSRGK